MPAEYACEDCHKSFPTPSKLAAHQNRKFPCTAGDFPCNKCPATFTKRSARDRHQRNCSGPKKTFGNLQAELEALQTQFAAQTTEIQQAEQKPAAEDASLRQDEPSQPPADSITTGCHETGSFEFEKTSKILQLVSFDDLTAADIKHNPEMQETASETNPVCLFGNAVPSAAEFHKTSSLKLLSVTNIVNFRLPSIYTRQVFDRVSDVYPVGRPQDMVSPKDLAGLAVVKIGSQGDHTNRQVTHTKAFTNSILLDSKLTNSYTHVEIQAKDVWKNNGELYEGLFEGKTTRDTELLLVKNQEDYERQVLFYHGLCKPENTIELQLAQEKSRQVEAEARKAEAKADAQKAKADAQKAEAIARKVETDFEILKFKLAHGMKLE